MAVTNRNSLVLNGVGVVNDVVTGTMGFGFDPADVQAPAIPFSRRHPSHRYPQAERRPGLWQSHVDRDVDTATDRAGRPGSVAGVLASRSPALSAGRTMPMCWSPAMGGTRSAVAWRLVRMTAQRTAPVGNVLPGRLQALCAVTKRTGASRSELKRTGEALAASRRGEGARPMGIR